MLVINNTPRLEYIKLAEHEQITDQLGNKTTAVKSVRTYKLIPGMPCDIPDSVLNAWRKCNKNNEALFKSGDYRIMGGDEQPNAEVVKAHEEGPAKQDAETKKFMLDAMKAAGIDKYSEKDSLKDVRDAYEEMLNPAPKASGGPETKDDCLDLLGAAGAVDANGKPYDKRYSLDTLKQAVADLEQ